MYIYQTVIGMTELYAAPSVIFQCSFNVQFLFERKKNQITVMTTLINLKKPDCKFKTILFIYRWFFTMSLAGTCEIKCLINKITKKGVCKSVKVMKASKIVTKSEQQCRQKPVRRHDVSQVNWTESQPVLLKIRLCEYSSKYPISSGTKVSQVDSSGAAGVL